MPVLAIRVQDCLGRRCQSGYALAPVGDAASQPDLRGNEHRDHASRLLTNHATASGLRSPINRMLRPFANAPSTYPAVTGSGLCSARGSSMISTGSNCVSAMASPSCQNGRCLQMRLLRSGRIPPTAAKPTRIIGRIVVRSARSIARSHVSNPCRSRLHVPTSGCHRLVSGSSMSSPTKRGLWDW